MVITIDGPSGAGKSTVSRELAGRLGFAVLDTGALYRAVALGAEWDGLSTETDESRIAAWLAGQELTTRIGEGRFVVLWEGRDVEPFIRNEGIGALASRLSALGVVRRALLDAQRRAAAQGDLVAEGRDMGTVVFPGAEVKFFLTASDAERARRRYGELKGSTPGLTLKEVESQLAERDRQDSARALSPLRPAGDAFVVDSSEMGIDEVVDWMAARVAEARA